MERTGWSLASTVSKNAFLTMVCERPPRLRGMWKLRDIFCTRSRPLLTRRGLRLPCSKDKKYGSVSVSFWFVIYVTVIPTSKGGTNGYDQTRPSDHECRCDGGRRNRCVRATTHG